MRSRRSAVAAVLLAGCVGYAAGSTLHGAPPVPPVVEVVYVAPPVVPHWEREPVQDWADGPELRPAWREVHPDDEQPWEDDAGCTISILTMLGLDILGEYVIALLDWSDFAYGGPCAYWEVLGGLAE